jgi:hypothetical protein
LTPTHTYADFCYKNHVHTPQRLGTKLVSLSRQFVSPHYKQVQTTWAARTRRKVLLPGGLNQYKSLCPRLYNHPRLDTQSVILFAGGY